MSEPASPSDRREGAEPPADEERARAYADGFGEGIRAALKDILQHVSQGYTASELRLLVQGRLARVGEEVELKRRSLLAPPRARADLLFASPSAPPRNWSPQAAKVRVLAGQSYLVNERRPARALALLAETSDNFPRTILLSLRPPTVAELPPDRRVELSITAEAPSAGSARPLPLGQVAGRLHTAMVGGVLVYTDALEFLLAGDTEERAVQFAVWLTEEARRSSSAVIASVDAEAFDLRQFSLLQRAFSTQA